MMQPLISVLMPAYNQGSYITESIESVLKQDYPLDRIEVIVVDDGSTDNTSEILAKYAPWDTRAQEPRKPTIKVIKQQNYGQAWAVKRGIDEAAGKYIFVLNGDDIFFPDKIRRIVDIFEGDKKITHVAHPTIYWHADTNRKIREIFPSVIVGKKIEGADLLSFFLRNNTFYGGGSNYAGKSSEYKKAKIKKEINMSIDEYLTYISSIQGYVYFLEEPLTFYRLHEENYSQKPDKEILRKDMTASKAILEEILSGGFTPEIEVLYTLKTKLMDVKIKEWDYTKSFLDIMDMWRFLFRNRIFLQCKMSHIIRKYGFVKHSLPSIVINFFRELKGESIFKKKQKEGNKLKI